MQYNLKYILIIIKMQININNINLENLTSELVNNLKNNSDDNNEIYINITEQDLNDFNERIINPSNINAIIKLCDFLMIDYYQMKQLIINNIKPTNEKYILNDINKENCKDLLFIENMTIDNILEYDMIEWLKFKFTEYNKKTLCDKATNRAIKCLKYAHENGCPWNSWTCVYAAQNAQLECLKYLHENGCPWDEWTCSNAARNGQLECLKYARDNGCPWNGLTCTYAAGNGQLECLKYLHENGCPWNDETCLFAAKYGQLECLKYAHENGCPWNKKICTQKGYIECVTYAKENGCPC
jgi:hypothetical protein